LILAELAIMLILLFKYARHIVIDEYYKSIKSKLPKSSNVE